VRAPRSDRVWDLQDVTLPFESVLVANRGEVALRIGRTLQAMGIRWVAVYTDTELGSLHARAADAAFRVESYLDADALVAAAIRAGAAALHPGYGFLSESPALARACATAGVTFVGPPPEAMEQMGDKIAAKRVAASAGVPIVPGVDCSGMDDSEVEHNAIEVGLPVLLKPSAGGGGKGMRLIEEPISLRSAIEAARREARAAFGDDTLMIERFVSPARHVEVQILADSHGATVALGDRECSLQRRHQKVVEEAPAPGLDVHTRAAMAEAAMAVARACGYTNAGTVEFVVAADEPTRWYFLEMNTRLQVEHPVTEAVLGIDLVELQLRIAAGEPLPWRGEDSGAGVPNPRGHAIEARLYAEDPRRGFLPATGRVLLFREPRGVRVDSALGVGTEISTRFDPLLAKVVSWGRSRAEAVARLRGALLNTELLGVTSNVGFLARLLAHPEVVAGSVDTSLVERHSAELATGPADNEMLSAAGVLSVALGYSPGLDPWDLHDSWRVSGTAQQVLEWNEGTTKVRCLGQGEAEVDGAWVRYKLEGDHLLIERDGQIRRWCWAQDGATLWLGTGGDAWALSRSVDAVKLPGAAQRTSGLVLSPMPGTVLAVHVQPGEEVEKDQPLVTVEAMKMEHVVLSPSAGVVSAVLVKAGDAVALEEQLAVVGTCETA
jgi:acetyl-CoA/propionyl-CoA carboxylase biotin carboxyl carrier protein